MLFNLAKPLLASALALAMTGCAAPVVLVAAGATGYAVNEDTRTTGTIVDDNLAEMKAYSLLGKEESLKGENSHINVTIFNGIALLTGEISTEADKSLVESRVKQTPNVVAVVNRLDVMPNSSLKQRAEDTAVLANAKARIATVKQLNALRIKLVVERSVVYLMGQVTQAEGAIAAKAVLEAYGVKKVVKVFQYVD